MTIEQFYEVIETNTTATRDQIDEMTIEELSKFIKKYFNKRLVITFK